MPSVFRIGTRGSPLALVQANMVRDALCATHGWPESRIEIVVIRTTGDRVQDRALAEIGGKALWTKELDRALLGGEIDCAVHSMKDVETIRPEAIRIAALLPRADVRDRLVGADSIAALRHGAVLGTSSPRRAAQVKRLRPDVTTILFRGNVATRLAKLAAGEADATLLAAAGLERLGRDDVGVAIDTAVLLPAPAQGAVGIEVRADDDSAGALVEAIGDGVTQACVGAERALLARLVADCHSPVAALATIEGGVMHIVAELLAEDGSAHVTGAIRGEPGAALAEALADDLLDRAPESVRRLFAG
ncbi:hydroxymethylbilane synthase [Sphingomonas panacis]|uniref:hydroxymethylbilane synthase n=1 Tax=Sphingomonas panacis TaxID=1560345 RepID=UPI003B846CD0